MTGSSIILGFIYHLLVHMYLTSGTCICHVLHFRFIYIIGQCDVCEHIKIIKAPLDCTVTENRRVNLGWRQDYKYVLVPNPK